MTKAPERIITNASGTMIIQPPAIPLHSTDVEYTRTDHALALVAAEREAWAIEILTHIAAYKAIGQKGAYPRMNESFVNTIRARTPDDATAALKARDARIRNEALREAADRARKAHERWRDELTAHEVECDVTACEDIAADIESLITEGQSDGE